MSNRLAAPPFLLACTLLCAIAAPARAEETAPPAPCACATEEAPAKNHVEFSFGTSQLFVRESQVTAEGRTQLPTSSALLLAEWLGGERWSLMTLFNLPLGSQRTLVGGQLIEEPAAPVLALGARWSPLRFEVFQKKALFELQLAALVGGTLGAEQGDTYGPLVGARFHLHNDEGFAIYVGGSWAFIRESLALIYGIGHRF